MARLDGYRERVRFELPIWFDHESLREQPSRIRSAVFPAVERRHVTPGVAIDVRDTVAVIEGFRLEVIFDENPGVVSELWDRFLKDVRVVPAIGAKWFPAMSFIPWECSHCQAKHGAQAAQAEDVGGILLTAWTEVTKLQVLARQNMTLEMYFDDPDPSRPFYCAMLRVVVIGTMIRDVQ